MLKRLLLTCLLLHAACLLAPAQVPSTPGRTMKVAVFLEPPFVERQGGLFKGFAIDLWERIALSQGWRTTYQEVDNIPDMLRMVHTGEVDAAVSDLFITKDRLKDVDFSQPYFDAGLRIMVDEDRHGSFFGLWKGLSQAGHLKVFACGAGLIIVLSIALTLFERKWNPEFPKAWHAGMAEAFYHVMSVAMTGKTNHKEMFGAIGKVLAGIWLACGVAIVAYITSAIASVMTANRLSNQINGPADLASKTVGTISGSMGEEYCRQAMLNIQVFNTVPEAVKSLLKGQVNAIVYDAPVLENYDNSHPELPITEVGPLFWPQKYGFALPPNSPLTRVISLEILGAKEDGFLSRLKDRDFGNTE